MTQTIPDLWGPLDVTVISPIAVLRFQASQLRERTNGLLEGEVETTGSADELRHTFVVIAPALRRYRYGLLEVTHGKEDVFPAAVQFTWDEVGPDAVVWSRPNKAAILTTSRSAATTTEFVQLVGEALQSKRAKAIISSLIARSNESVAVGA